MDEVLRAVVVAPKHDHATEGSFKVAKTVELLLGKYGIDTTVLEEQDAVRKNLERVIREQHPTLIIYLGHGDSDVLYGQVPPGDRTPLVDDEKNPQDLRGTVTVAIACHSLNTLGNVAVFKGGCNIYMGSDSYYFLPGPSEEHDYLEDFARTILALIISLLEGESAKDALDQYASLCKEYEDQYEQMGTPESLTAKNWMASNRLSMGIRGEAAGGLIFGIYE